MFIIVLLKTAKTINKFVPVLEGLNTLLYIYMNYYTDI